MKKRTILLIAAIACGTSFNASAQFNVGGKRINLEKAVRAGTDVAKAITLTDQDVATMSREYMEWMDTHNPLEEPTTPYGERLERLTKNYRSMDGLELNYAVYRVVDVNAFACGDGSVRVCAGLMDRMNDDELMAVIAHEIGHVVHTDSKDAMKSAYLRSAAKNAAGAASQTVAKLTDSELGALAEAVAGAQFSQKQETAADDYAFDFCLKNKIDPYAMHNALAKLIDPAAQPAKTSAFRQLLSSHPETQKRMARMKEAADKHAAN